MPLDVIHALAWIKWAAARVNATRLLLEPAAPGHRGCGARVAAGEFDARVPAVGLADRLRHAKQHERQRGGRQPGVAALRGGLGAARRVHPNDDVNLGQSSNDVFPTAMHLARGLRTQVRLLLPRWRPAREQCGKAALSATRGQGRPHPPAGRHAGHPGPGVRRL
jgi:fumarate hydratase class II